MEILFFKGVSSLRCLETPKAHRTLVNKIQGLGITPGDHMCVYVIDYLGNGFLKHKGVTKLSHPNLSSIPF